MKRLSILAAIVIAILVTTSVFSATAVFAQTPTPTPTATPTPTPTPTPFVIGGIAEAPDADASALGATDSGGSSGTTYAVIVGIAAGALMLGAGGWYARRRWLS